MTTTMLQESQELFNKLKDAQKGAQIKIAKKKATRLKITKFFTSWILPITISIVLLFPKQSGYIIGSWINKFFGTIIKESTK